VYSGFETVSRLWIQGHLMNLVLGYCCAVD
jgi:hypothetical protein